MNQKIAEPTRRLVIELVRSARQDGKDTLSVQSGYLHKELGLNNRYPAVCSALDSCKGQKILRYAGLDLIGRVGPRQGATACFTFRLLPVGER